MTIWNLLFFVACFLGGATKTFGNVTAVAFISPSASLIDTSKTVSSKDSLSWIDDFKLFRTAVYKNDVAAVKSYFKFPVFNPGNEIWYLVLPEAAIEKRKVSGDKQIAFQEADLVKYYKKIFSEAFKKSILKIRAEELYTKNYFETSEQKEGTGTTYKMYVTYDKKTKILSFNLAFNTVAKDENGEVLDGGESSVVYNFKVQKNGHILFKEVRLAG